MTSEALDKMWKILKDNEFQIDVAISSDIICTSCKHVMIKPYNVPCGCRYCYDCLTRYLNGEQKFCSGDSDYCQSELINMDTNVFIDQPVSIKISRSVVKCPLESCEFKTELGKMADHMRTCDRRPVTCPYFAIGCEKNKIGVDKMKLHFKQENYCHGRLLMEFLDNWKNEVKLLKSKMINLEKENKLIKEQVESKQETISALEENVRKLLEENICLGHFKEQMRTIIEVINQENISLREELEIIKLNVTAKEEMISSLQTKSNEEQQERGKQKEKCEFIEKKQDQLKSRIDKMSQENTETAKKSKETESEIKIIQTKINQFQANQNCGEFVWCLENWDEKNERARKGIERFIYSEPFYSHKNGYKMCLKLFPDGNSASHLSLYICIMRGEFDNILQWPFSQMIKLEVMNQKSGLAHVSKMVISKNSSSSNWKRPNNERNDGSGYLLFIQLSELSSNDALCQGNQIWIRATPQMNP